MPSLSLSPAPAVSVVMPVLNPHPTYFPLAVRSVLEQTFSDWELVIVEDPSERSAKEMLTPFDDPRIRHVANLERTGLIAQRNRGLAEARAEIVALLDADDIAEPRRLAEQTAFLSTHPDVVVLGSQLTLIDENGERLGYRRYPLEHDAIVRALPRFSPLANPATIYRKQAVLDAGGYQRYPGSEDYDLWCRLALRGCRFANAPQPLLRYRIHRDGLKALRLRTLLRNTVAIKRQYFPHDLDWTARLRMLGERLLLAAPPSLVMWLFLSLNCSRKLPELP